MYTIQDVFKVLKFLYNNPKSEITENYLTQSAQFIDRTIATTKSLVFDKSLNPSDSITIQTSLNAREKANSYFENVLRQLPFETVDYSKLERFIMEWYSANKTFLDLIKVSSNPYSLPTGDVDLALQGFGARLFNENLIKDKNTRVLLLVSLAELYKIKGSPKSILTGLSFIGFDNLTLREWWVIRDPAHKDNLLLEGKAVKKGKYWDETYKQYRFIDDQEHVPIQITWDNFEKRLYELGDPHWQYKKEEILEIDNDQNTYLKLPSITPYYSIIFNNEMNTLNQVLAMLEKMITDEFNFYLYGIDYKYIVNIEGYKDPVSILDLWLGLIYSLVRADDEKNYNDLSKFLKEKAISHPNFKYPYAYEQLILWCNTNVPLEILMEFKPNLNPYYGATNELIDWWNKDESRVGTQIPEIFFTIFKFQRIPYNLENDYIHYYTGNKYIEGTTFLDIERILKDYNTLLYNTPFSRVIKPSWYTSTTASHELGEVTYPELMQKLQEDYFNETFHETYKDYEIIYDTEKYDGSQLTYTSNSDMHDWAIDNLFYYKSPQDNTWWRISVQHEWTTVFLPKYPVLNEAYFHNGYIYRYVSQNKWIRYQGTLVHEPPVDATWEIGDVRYNIAEGSIQECIKTQENQKLYITSFFDKSWSELPIRENIFSFPILKDYITLDLTNRYDAERLLKGNRALRDIANIDFLVKEIGNKILVCGFNDTPPIVYEYRQVNTPSGNILLWEPTDIQMSEINLGINNELIRWIDEQANSYSLTEVESGYQKIAYILSNEMSTFISTYFRTTGIDYNSYFQKFRSSKELLSVVNFFKPKRARLLFYALHMNFDDRLHNTVLTDEIMEHGKIFQSIDTFVPIQDTQFIFPDSGIFNRQYHLEAPSIPYDIGVLNHWNIHHPRDASIKATVSPEQAGRSSKHWQIGYCKYDPRVIFASGKLGTQENITGGRFEQFDMYLIPGYQYGIIEFQGTAYKRRLHDEIDFIIKGGCEEYREKNDEFNPGPHSLPETEITEHEIIERPIHHRPLFIGIKEWVQECYPNKIAGCCDYYDTECLHDGEDNPHLTRWNGVSWTPVERDFVKLEVNQRNIGDTYCTPCGPDTFTPSNSIIYTPKIYQKDGVYHTSIIARGFENTLAWLNGEWESYSFENDYSTSTEESFKHGYKKFDNTSSSSSEDFPKLIRFYNRQTGYYYWKVLDENNVVLIVSSLKDKIHDISLKDELLPRDTNFVREERSNLLNGNDKDVCNDTWGNFIGDENIINGGFSTLEWVRYKIETDWSDRTPYPNSPGIKNEIRFDGDYLYEYIDEPNTWIRTEVETDWNDEIYVYPDSLSDYYKSFVKNNYLYVHIDIDRTYKQWVRIPCDISWDALFTTIIPDEDKQLNATKLIPSELKPLNTRLLENGAMPHIYRSSYTITSEYYNFCGNVLPFLETYRGLLELYKFPDEIICSKYGIWDELSDIYEAISFKETIRAVNNWKYNTWQGFEPEYEQSASWSELGDEITWEDLEEQYYGPIPPMNEHEWNGIRSHNIDTYNYWYDILSNKSMRYKMFNWPSFMPDLDKNSDTNFWYIYDRIKNGIIEHLYDERINFLDECEIQVFDRGPDGEKELIPEELWKYLPKMYLVHEDYSKKMTEDNIRRRVEFENQIVP